MRALLTTGAVCHYIA